MKVVCFAGVFLLAFVYKADCGISEWYEPLIVGVANGYAAASTPIPENTPEGNTAITVMAGPSPLSYILIRQTPSGPGTFDVANDGTITLAGELNYGVARSYDLEIMAIGTGLSTGTATVLINITDVEEPLVFDQEYYVSCMDHGAGANAVVLSVTATDEDPWQTVTYAIISGNTGTDFAVHSTTGQITVLNVLDKSRTAFYALEINATSSYIYSCFAKVYIVVSDTNDAVAIMSGMVVTTIAFSVANFL